MDASATASTDPRRTSTATRPARNDIVRSRASSGAERPQCGAGSRRHPEPVAGALVGESRPDLHAVSAGEPPRDGDFLVERPTAPPRGETLDGEHHVPGAGERQHLEAGWRVAFGGGGEQAGEDGVAALERPTTEVASR